MSFTNFVKDQIKSKIFWLDHFFLRFKGENNLFTLYFKLILQFCTIQFSYNLPDSSNFGGVFCCCCSILKVANGLNNINQCFVIG